MDPDDWTRLRPILEELLERPQEEHQQILDRKVGEDAQLRRRVLQMLERERGDEGLTSLFDRPPALRRAGDRIGPYRLRRLLGRGGMGEVWLADREDEHFRKQVALKLVRYGMATLETLGRFRRERQVLATLDHPGIARLLDGGATEEGLPFYVMEYVDGEPIDAYCSARGLDVRARLELFLQVCEAVQHAHAGLVVHRDLKPSNVFVTADGACKLLDFGIAKLLDDEHEHSLLTIAGQRPLTMRYASPEQVRGEAIGVASDVYSLGVLLYELLTGRSPYPSELSATSLERAVSEHDPRRPSTRILTESGVPGTAPHDRRRQARSVRGDLDNIVLTALRKERPRRYASVEALAEDLRRYLAGLPVRARPNTALYRARRFVHRNRLGVAAAAAVLASLTTGLVVSTRMYLHAEVEREEATWQAYVASIAAVDAALGQEHLSLAAEERLAAAPPALRGWEWDYQRARLDRSMQSLRTAGNALTVALSPDGRHVASAPGFPLPDGSFMLEVWETASGERVLFGKGHADFARDLDFSPDGARVVTVSDDRTVLLWDLGSGEIERQIEPGLGPLTSVAFHPQGALLAVGAQRGGIALLDRRSGATLLELEGHLGAVKDLVFTRDGGRLGSAALDGSARLWDLERGRELRRYAASGAALGIALREDDDLLVVLTADARALRFRLSDGARLSTAQGPSPSVERGALSADGELAAVPCEDRCVRVWETRFGDVVGELRGDIDKPDGIWGLAFSADGARLATSAWERSVRLWEVETRPPRMDLAGHSSVVGALAAHPDGERLASCSSDGTVRLWNARAGILLRTLQAHPRGVSCVAFSPAGDRLVSGATDDAAILWDPDTGEQLERIEHPTRSACFSPDGAWLALGGPDGSVRLQPRDSGEPRHLEGPRQVVRALAFSADGRWLVTAHDPRAWGRLGYLLLWDLRSGAEVARMECDFVPASAVFPADGESLLLAGYTKREGRLLQLGLPELELLQRWTIPHQWRMGMLALSPDGRRLLVPTSQSEAQVWDTRLQREVFALRGHGGTVWAAVWSPDGRWVATACSDQLVRVWSSHTAREDVVPMTVRRLVERHQLTSEVEGALQADAWLSPEQRAEALRMVRLRPDDLAGLRACAESQARLPVGSVRARRQALACARALIRVQPDDADALRLEGLLLFRLGALAEARASLLRSLARSPGSSKAGSVCARVFLAMTRARLEEPGARGELEALVADPPAERALTQVEREALQEARLLLAGT